MMCELPANDFNEIIRYGTFYFPAYKHYGVKASVRCDRCQRSNLNSCIGYGSKDLCLNCAEIVSNSIYCTNEVLPHPYDPLNPNPHPYPYLPFPHPTATPDIYYNTTDKAK